METTYLPQSQGLKYSEHYSASEAGQHVLTSLLTYSVIILSIYNAKFDPFRLLPPRSLILSSLIIPWSMIVTRIIGQNKFHYQTFEVFVLFDTRNLEPLLCLLLGFIAYRSRNLSTSGTTFKGLFLRVYPVFFSLLKIFTLTPIYQDSSSQKKAIYLASFLDTLTLFALVIYAAGYSGLIGWRILRGSWKGIVSLISLLRGS